MVSTKVQQTSLGVYYAIGDILTLCLRYHSYYLYAYVVSSTVQQSIIVVLKRSIYVFRLLCYRGCTDSMLTLPVILILCLRSLEYSPA